MDRFTLRILSPDGTSTYSAPHELHNEVHIIFPAGYWDHDGAPPDWVDIRFEIVRTKDDPTPERPMLHEGNTPKDLLDIAAAHPNTRHLTEVKVFPECKKPFKHPTPEPRTLESDLREDR